MMNAKHFLALFALWMGVFLPSNAFAGSADVEHPTSYLTGDALRAVFLDTTMSGEYRVIRGVTKTHRYTEFHRADGTSDYVEGGLRDPGLWYILGGDKICYRYPKSKAYKRTYCFVVYNDDGCYYKFSTHDMTLNGPRNWDYWTSRAVRKGHGGSCDAPIG